MSNTTGAKRPLIQSSINTLVALALGLCATVSQPAFAQDTQKMTQSSASAQSVSETLSPRQQAILPIAAYAASGDIAKLGPALEQGLDAQLTVSDAKEILIQLYAYAGFPRSLNALGELMKVVDARKKRGVQDAPGKAPSRPIPTGDALMAAGKANQTKLAGGPVEGPLFNFAPAANEYLRAHLFGDIFERDNLDWQSRELATVGMLAAIPGVDSQLLAHIRISMNVGISAAQIRQVVLVLADRVDGTAASRVESALNKHLAAISQQTK